MTTPSNRVLNSALADALRASIDAVQEQPVILACRWCGERSNPRADAVTAIGDLDDHLSEHEEFMDALVAAWGGDRQSLADALDAYAQEAADV